MHNKKKKRTKQKPQERVCKVGVLFRLMNCEININPRAQLPGVFVSLLLLHWESAQWSDLLNRSVKSVTNHHQLLKDRGKQHAAPPQGREDEQHPVPHVETWGYFTNQLKHPPSPAVTSFLCLLWKCLSVPIRFDGSKDTDAAISNLN